MQIRNVPKHSTPKELKKLLSGQHGIAAVKVKKGQGWTHAFATFRDTAARTNAIAALNGLIWRGKKLQCSVAAANLDPASRKRGGSDDERTSSKRPRRSDGSGEGAGDGAGDGGPELPLEEQLQDKVTPLWRVPYEQQLKTKRRSLRKKLVKIFGQLPAPHPQWAVEARRDPMNESLPFLLGQVTPSPVTKAYRNKCEFSIGRSFGGGAVVVGHNLGTYRDGE